MKIGALGYVGINATDLDAWEGFATDVLGVQVRDDSGPDELLLKTDDHRWRIALHRAEADGFAYAGLELAHAEALAGALDELRAEGVDVTLATDDELKARGVGAMGIVHDPAGNRLELYCRPSLDYGFRSPTGARFVTEGMGLGHAVFLVESERYEACLDFYVRVLGFKVSEYTTIGPIQICFLHCNRRHHSIALARGPFNMCHHVLFQVADVDMVGRALDRALDRGVPITSTLGRHRNDQMLSFYMRSPGGMDVEYGWGAAEVDDDTWVVSEWVGGDVWGHRGIEQMAEDL